MRREDWPTRLAEVVRLHQSQPYRWGKFDCMRFVGDCIGAVTGIDHMAALPAYDCQMGAGRALKASGFTSSYEFFARTFEPLPGALLGQGDVGFVQVKERIVAPYVVLGDAATNRAYDGWHTVRLTDLKYGFRID